MPTVILNTKSAVLDWSAKGAARIAQNVQNLISTVRYEVAYNRTMGINPDIFDSPAPTAAALYAADVYRLGQEYEPRAQVKSVKSLGISSEGDIEAEVVIEV